MFRGFFISVRKKNRHQHLPIFSGNLPSKTYSSVHSGGVKKEYLWRLHALHRAKEAGIEDVGMDALFGLYDYNS